MDKATLVETLLVSEKKHSVVRIKIFNTDKPVVGAVQKVLNHIIILKSSAAEPITLTFADIESVNDSEKSFVSRILQHAKGVFRTRFR